MTAAADLAFDGRPCPNAWDMAMAFGKVRRHKQGTWYICFGRHGKVWSLKGEPFESELQAEQVLRSIQGSVAGGMPKRAAVERWLPVASRAHRVGRWLKMWVADVESREQSGELSPTYVREIHRWTRDGGYIAALSNRSIQSIDKATVKEWQRELRKVGLSGKTLWNVTAGLGAFLGWLADEEAIQHKPRIPWPRFDEYVPEIVSTEVQDRILEAIPEDRRGIFLAMAHLGLRHGEAFALSCSDYRDGRLWIRTARKGRRIDAPVRGPKNRRPRVLPAPDEVREWIAKHVSSEALLAGGPLFVNPRTKRPWTATSFRRTWERACKVAGVGTLNAYETLRHSTATDWLRKGASEREVQALLGHRTNHATPRYARLAETRLDSIVGRRGRTEH